MYLQRAERSSIANIPITLVSWNKKVKNKVAQYSYFGTSIYSDVFYGTKPIIHNITFQVADSNYDKIRDNIENSLRNNAELQIGICNYKHFGALILDYSITERGKRRGFCEFTLRVSEIEQERRLSLVDGNRDIFVLEASSINSEELSSVDRLMLGLSRRTQGLSDFKETITPYYNRIVEFTSNASAAAVEIAELINRANFGLQRIAAPITQSYEVITAVINRFAGADIDFDTKNLTFLRWGDETQAAIRSPGPFAEIQNIVRSTQAINLSQVSAALVNNVNENNFTTRQQKLSHISQVSKKIDEAIEIVNFLPALRSLEASKTNLARIDLENVAFPNAKTFEATGQDVFSILKSEIGNSTNYRTVLSYNRIPNPAAVHGTIEVF